MKGPATPRQRRTGAAISGICGIALIGIGIVYVIPEFSLLYGGVWILMAAVITVLNFYHVFCRNDKDPEFARAEVTRGPVYTAAAQASTPQMVPPAPSTGSGTDQQRQAQLAQLDRLLESGILTREEYQERKDRLSVK